jgi:hypothetical protein
MELYTIMHADSCILHSARVARTHTKASHVVNNLKIYVNKYIYGHPAARNMRSLKYYCAHDKQRLHVYTFVFIRPLTTHFLFNPNELFEH